MVEIVYARIHMILKDTPLKISVVLSLLTSFVISGQVSLVVFEFAVSLLLFCSHNASYTPYCITLSIRNIKEEEEKQSANHTVLSSLPFTLCEHCCVDLSYYSVGLQKRTMQLLWGVISLGNRRIVL